MRAHAEMLDLANILVMDMDNRIIFWNKGAEELYGFAKDEAIGISSHKLLQTRFPKTQTEIKAEILQEGQWDGELTHTKKDGTSIIVASHWVLYRDKEGKPATIIEVNNDITGRKCAEKELQEAKDHLEIRIEERTEELEEANRRLLEEIAERKRAEDSTQGSRCV